MTGLPRKVARRWYLAGTLASIIAVIFAVISQTVSHRIGYPLAFMFTMFGILAVTRPNWEWPERRPGVVVANSGVFLTQIAILWMGLTSGS